MSNETSQAKQCWFCKAVAHNSAANCFACGRAYADAPAPAEVGLDLHMLRHEVLEAAKALYQHLGEPLALQPQKKMLTLYGAVERLIAGEEEHAKILRAFESSEAPFDAERAKGKALVCRKLRSLANSILDGAVSIADEGLAFEGEELETFAETFADAASLIDGMTAVEAVACLCKWEERNPFNPDCPVHGPKPSKPENPERDEQPADDPRAYEKKRCAGLSRELRAASMDVVVGRDDNHAAHHKKLLWDAAYWLDRMANR